MNTFPKVSVVTTTYNDIENLKRILAEVKKQTYPNIEHIIVDGGSTDGTVDLGCRKRTMVSTMPSIKASAWQQVILWAAVLTGMQTRAYSCAWWRSWKKRVRMACMEISAIWMVIGSSGNGIRARG